MLPMRRERFYQNAPAGGICLESIAQHLLCHAVLPVNERVDTRLIPHAFVRKRRSVTLPFEAVSPRLRPARCPS